MSANNFPNIPNHIREAMMKQLGEQIMEEEEQIRKESARFAELIKEKYDEDSKSNP